MHGKATIWGVSRIFLGGTWIHRANDKNLHFSMGFVDPQGTPPGWIVQLAGEASEPIEGMTLGTQETTDVTQQVGGGGGRKRDGVSKCWIFVLRKKMFLFDGFIPYTPAIYRYLEPN